MRILIVSPTATHPANSGSRARVQALAATLMRAGHELHMAYVKRDSPGDEAAMAAFFGGNFHLLSYRQPARRESGLQRLTRRVRNLWDVDSRHAFGIDDWYDDAIDAPLLLLQQRLAFDAVMVEYGFLSRALDLFDAQTLKVLDTHDVFAGRHRQFIAQGLQPEWFSTRAADEGIAVRRADVTIAIQAGEIDHFRQLGARRVVEVGHLQTLQRIHPTPAAGARMLFVGGSSPINADGIGHFIGQVLPRIRQQLPAAVLQVAGGVCERLAQAPGVELLGRVDDLLAAYAGAGLVVNPVRLGTGLNIKSAEALGHGLPLLSSSTGARGFEPLIGQGLLCEDEPEAMARAALSVLCDPARARALSDAAWDWMSRSNQRHTQTLLDLFSAAGPRS
ncbi:MAG: glycosyltransferase family 4 protein [Burkholderiaceae bacterium]|nr:glycosyltransferase family 4 protein [Burkholderiaceae bacterium]